MKSLAYIMTVLLAIGLLIGSYELGKKSVSSEIIEVGVDRVDTVVRVDTLIKKMPLPSTVITKLRTDTVVTVTKDTIAVELPFTTEVYQDSDYFLQLTAYKPHIDSLVVYPKTTTIETTRFIKEKNKIRIKPSLQIGYGYGLTTRKPDLYMGIGASITF